MATPLHTYRFTIETSRRRYPVEVLAADEMAAATIARAGARTDLRPGEWLVALHGEREAAPANVLPLFGGRP